MKISYKVKRTINTGNYENIVIEYGLEEEVSRLGKSIEELSKYMEKTVEDFIQDKEAEIRAQLEEPSRSSEETE